MSGRRDIIHCPDGLALKKASKGLIRAVGGTDGAAASLSESGERHVRQQRMSDCTNANTADFLRIDEAADLEDLSVGQPGWPHVTRALAKRQGFALLALPERVIGDSNLHRALAAAVEETGQATSKSLSILADGKATAPEIRELRILDEIDEAIDAWLSLKALVVAIDAEAK